MAAAAGVVVPIPSRSIFSKNQDPHDRLPLQFYCPPPSSSSALPMAKILLLQSSEGKVLMAPTWDKRPTATQALPVQTGIPSRALERVLQFWTKHALAANSGESPESLARWDADFSRRLHQDGLDAEFAAAIQKLHLVRRGRRPEATRHPVASAAPTEAAPATRAARAGPVDVWSAVHARGDPVSVVSSDRAAASRAHGRQQAEHEESACHHRKRLLTKMSPTVAPKSCSSIGSAPAPAAASLKKMTAKPELSIPAPLSLRARRGLPELSCKCPKQSHLVAASRKKIRA